MGRVIGLDEINLKKMYLDWGWSTIKIAKELGCSDQGVGKALDRYDIPRRSHAEAIKRRVMTPEHLAKLRENASKLNKGNFGDKHPNWKDARHIDRYGYVLVRRDGKTVREHRWVMEQHLGRKLKVYEEVHHINHIKADNRLENLEVFESWHKKRHIDENPNWPSEPTIKQ